MSSWFAAIKSENECGHAKYLYYNHENIASYKLN